MFLVAKLALKLTFSSIIATNFLFKNDGSSYLA